MEIRFNTDALTYHPGLSEDYSKIERVIASRAQPELTLNLEAVEYISSDSLSWLVRFGQIIRDKGGVYRLINVRPSLRFSLDIANLGSVARIENVQGVVAQRARPLALHAAPEDIDGDLPEGFEASNAPDDTDDEDAPLDPLDPSEAEQVSLEWGDPQGDSQDPDPHAAPGSQPSATTSASHAPSAAGPGAGRIESKAGPASQSAPLPRPADGIPVAQPRRPAPSPVKPPAPPTADASLDDDEEVDERSDDSYDEGPPDADAIRAMLGELGVLPDEDEPSSQPPEPALEPVTKPASSPRAAATRVGQLPAQPVRSIPEDSDPDGDWADSGDADSDIEDGGDDESDDGGVESSPDPAMLREMLRELEERERERGEAEDAEDDPPREPPGRKPPPGPRGRR